MYHASDSANSQGGCSVVHSAAFNVNLVRGESITVISLVPSTTASELPWPCYEGRMQTFGYGHTI
jgi:hypothetical protein